MILISKNNLTIPSIWGVICVLIISCQTPSNTYNDVVLTINGITVPEAEYRLFLQQNKAITYNHFFQKYGLEKDENFWKTSYQGESPAVFIKERTNDRLIEIKTLQKYAATLRIVKPFNYDTLVNDWKLDNKNRLTKKIEEK